MHAPADITAIAKEVGGVTAAQVALSWAVRP
jgi:diketogulonate reductase-like aldo/keto reductase